LKYTFDNKRIIKSALIDLFLMMIVCAPILLSIYWIVFHFDNDTHKVEVFVTPKIDKILLEILPFYSYFVMLWLFFRDAFNLSLGKRMQRITIMDRSTKQEASKSKKALRNITFLFLFPLEIVMKVAFPKARLGDMIANTVLIAN
jgi:uncharacterized RDD family membrane protein YckC